VLYTNIDSLKQAYSAGFNTVHRRFKAFHISYSDYSFRVVRKNLTAALTFCKFDWFHKFTIAVDIIAYDQPGKIYRFTVVYYLQSISQNNRLQVITQLDNLQHVETVTLLFKSANWSEREIWDMYGIFVVLHPDLRRILTDYGFSGFPLRKDFPLSGYVELMYSDQQKNPVYKKVELTQEFRAYNYSNPWIKVIIHARKHGIAMRFSEV
jgi:NADH-quinone oxidoreductase subunit C